MGCGISTNNISNLQQPKCHYTVFVHRPNEPEPLSFAYAHSAEFIAFPELMNLLAFDESTGAAFDANFVSVYDQESKKFKYYVHRLIGIEVEDEINPENGQAWMPYVNGQLMNWSDMCEKDVNVIPTDHIEWKFELYSTIK